MIRFREGFYADVRTEDRFRTIITYRDGALAEYLVRREKRAFLRVYDGKLWYYASVTDTDKISDELDRLYDVATPNPDILRDPAVRRFEVNRASEFKFRDKSVRDVPAERKNELLSSYLPLLSEDECMSMPRAIYLDRNSEYTFASSLGADIEYDYQTCGLSFGCGMVEGDKRFSAHKQIGDTVFENLFGKEDEIHASMREQIEFMREGVSVIAGTYPVVLSPEAAGIFAHESFGHKSESDLMLSDETMKDEWQIGKKVGSSILSIADCGEIPGCGYVPYDDEGTKARKNYLIKDGILKGRLHSVSTACALDEGVTGNSRAIDCTFEPIVRMTNTYIEAGDLTFDELIAPIKKGYFIKTVNHGSGMSTFTIAPALAYEIVNGKIGRPAKISVITGNVFETLGLIDGLTKDVQMLSFVTGGCGKLEQSRLPVGFGGPYVRVSSMNVQ